jgi:hypothetical protein
METQNTKHPPRTKNEDMMLLLGTIAHPLHHSGFIPGWKEGDADSGLILAWNFQLARPYSGVNHFPTPSRV